MVHQCVHCGKVYEVTSREILEGCSCGSHFFFFIKPEQFEKLQAVKMPIELEAQDKKKVERDVREMLEIKEEEVPVILDLESIKVTAPGKFEIDIVNLFNKSRPLIYKLEEGKYIIDIASALKTEKENKEGI